jgi:YHS domain-containing protein
MKNLLIIFPLLFGFLGTCQHATKQENIKPAQDPDTYANLNSDGVILQGYDAVAFFTDAKPVKGIKAFQSTFKGSIYQFASAEHKQLFDSNPEKYKVLFGGWCAYAVSLGRVAPIIIDTWSIVDGKLVVQHNDRAVRGWNQDVKGNLIKANKYWAYVAGNKGEQILTDEEKGYLVNVDEKKDRLILGGYDPVAYFKANKPVKGLAKFSARVDGATYWFSSEENQNAFKDNPEKYMPQYGGFCAYALSRNLLRPIDPTIFQIVDGRLMLQHSKQADKLFKEDVTGNVKLADANWPALVKARAGKAVSYDAPAN